MPYYNLLIIKTITMKNTFTITVSHNVNGDLQQFREIELENTPEGVASALVAFGQIVQEANYVDACSIAEAGEVDLTS